jgi:magnesium-transporting ATPase (P-type)
VRDEDTGALMDVLSLSERHVLKFSGEGLRCLVVGEAVLAEDWYQEWAARYRAAKADLAQIEARKAGLPNAIEACEEELERGLDLLGVTALEDKLQEGVPEAVATLARAGLKIWMLTGDKEETAVNIAVACNLVLPAPHMRQVPLHSPVRPLLTDWCSAS